VVINKKKRRTPEDDKHETNIKSGIAYGAAVSLFAAVVGG